MKSYPVLAFSLIVFVPALWAGDLDEVATDHLIAANNQQFDVRNQARPIAITGDGNQVHVQGATSTLAIMGNNNTVELDQVDKIVLFGTNNLVTFLGGLSRTNPEVVQAGGANAISRKPPPPTVRPTTD
jgi:hypothetical protein